MSQAQHSLITQNQGLKHHSFYSFFISCSRISLWSPSQNMNKECTVQKKTHIICFSGWDIKIVCLFIYVYIYIYIHTHTHIYTYISSRQNVQIPRTEGVVKEGNSHHLLHCIVPGQIYLVPCGYYHGEGGLGCRHSSDVGGHETETNTSHKSEA